LEIKSDLERLDESIEVQEVSAAAIARAPIKRGKTRTPMPRTVRLATKRPWLVIGIWAVFAVILGTAGLFAKQVLHAEDLVIRGTPSAQALAADKTAFGESTPLTIMLEGPQKALDASGPRLVRSLNRIEGVSVASPWSAGAPTLFRQSKERALLIASLDGKVVDAGRNQLPEIQARLEKLPPSVESTVAGQSRFSTELVNLVFAGALKAELLALPFLLLILLLIFRAPIAAAIPLIQGIAVIGVTTGFVTLLGLIHPVNILAQASGSIIGLALGVDYSLLFVARFREELKAGRSVEDAVATSLNTAGRTVAFAGGILVLAGLVVIGVSFGWASMTTGTIGVIAAAVFSVLAAFTLLPACLKVAGENINKWPIGGTTERKPRLVPLVNRIIDRPLLASVIVLIPLLLLCGSALRLQTGGPDLEMFKADNPMRQDMEKVSDVYGGGVMAPYEVLVTSPEQPVTSPKDIREFEVFQTKVAEDPAVNYVIGLGTNRVRNVTDASEDAPSSLAKLDVGLGAASSGARQTEKGLKTAASGANQLAAANNQALAGARQLANGFAQAQAGAGKLNSGLGKASSGAGQLDTAMAKLRSGTRELRLGTQQAEDSADGFRKGMNLLDTFVANTASAITAIEAPQNEAKSAIDQAISAIDALPAATQSEPGVQSARSALTSARSTANSAGSGISNATTQNNRVKATIALGHTWADRALSGVHDLDNGAATLNSGVDSIASSAKRLSSGIEELAAGSGQLNNGLAPLAGGTQSLANGLSSLSAGSDELAGGLTKGQKKSEKLSKGLDEGEGTIAALRQKADSQGAVDMDRVGKSPYLTMALLSAAPEEQKRNLNLVLNEQNGGTSTRAYIFTEDSPTSKEIAPFNDRLVESADKLDKAVPASVQVGGPGRTFLDYDNFTGKRIWVLLLALSLMSFLFLLVVFRSVLLAAKAVVLNLITVGAAMGLVALLYSGKAPLFGGPGWMEATSFFVVYSTTFALSMDYEIFMINRMRESYLKTGDNEQAIRDGVIKTASIITGSALVMCVLFVAMALTSDLVSSAQLGLGLAFAIAIDATIVRLVLLPATMRLFGDANWWMPRWLDRITPNVAIH
jgi:RND superfamily putative drug exporter